MSKSMRRKRISISTNDYLRVYGGSYGAIITPFYETLDNIRGLLIDDIVVSEHTKDGIVQLTLDNYDQDDNPPDPTVEVESVTLTLQNPTINEGETTKANVNVLPANAADRTVTYSSENQAIATVATDGTVTAIKAGTAVIVATSNNGKTGKATLTVKALPVEVQSVRVTLTKTPINVGGTTKATANVLPETADNKTVTFRSENVEIATVVQDGTVTGVRPGTTNIIATSANGKIGKAALIVNELPPVEVQTVGVVLDKSTIKEGATTKATAAVLPENAANKTVTFSSENQAIATVVQDGTVTGIKAGTTNIIATAHNGITGTVSLTVEALPVEVQTVNVTLDKVTIKEGATAKASVEVLPANAANKTVTYTSENQAIATVTSDGTVTGVKAGTTSIVATSNNGKVGKATITVEALPIEVQTVNVTLAKASIKEGATTTASVEVLPANAANKTVTYSSENEAIARVGADGTVTGVKAGTTKIVATSNNNKVGKANITVEALPVEVDSVKISLTQATINEGETTKATSSVLPDNAANKTITYRSDNDSIATVTSDGTVTGVKAGVTDIVATSNNNKFAKAKVTVVALPVEVSTVNVTLQEVSIEEGATTTATVEVLPANAANKTVTYSSEDDAIATVGTDGTVTGVKAGTTNIVATSANSKVGKAQITVTAVAPVQEDGEV